MCVVHILSANFRFVRWTVKTCVRVCGFVRARAYFFMAAISLSFFVVLYVVAPILLHFVWTLSAPKHDTIYVNEVIG